tara:strand:- start:11666 stop:13531 length:1866 start_codon:yes stop_codon:yes gene_type:complete
MNTSNLNCDVLVAGGGPAGIACAISAARNGSKVILCHDRSVLGGNSSSEVRMHIVGADGSGRRGVHLETETREGGIIEEIRLETTVRNPQRSASMLDLIFYDFCHNEPNLTLMLNTVVSEVEIINSSISSVTAYRHSTEDKFEIKAKIYCDCTGDGRLGFEANAKFIQGRESKLDFDEPLAQDKSDNKSLGSTILLQARKYNKPMPFIPPIWVRKFTEDELRFRPHGGFGVDQGFEYGYWWVEWGGHLDTIKDNEIIRDTLLSILLGVWDHIKNSGNHDADNWALDWFGFLPGKRESRRFIGQYILNQQDIQNSIPFEDSIAFGGWMIDTHPPEGVDAIDKPPANQIELDNIYDIPLRSCVAQYPNNLMFAGRNISATHIAFASTRVMATCFAIGQGVGTVAAYLSQKEIFSNKIIDYPKDIKKIQQRLIRDDSYLIGVLNTDENDLALQSEIKASSEQNCGNAFNILSGQTRSVHGIKGAKSDRIIEGTNRWMSKPEDGFPVFVELNWEKEIYIKEIQIIFDSGMHRVLTLSHSDAYVDKMIWGKPQPETVKDYLIEGFYKKERSLSLKIIDNFQRKNIHNLKEIKKVDKIRITILSTNGIDHARICEVRIYSSSDRSFK